MRVSKALQPHRVQHSAQVCPDEGWLIDDNIPRVSDLVSQRGLMCLINQRSRAEGLV